MFRINEFFPRQKNDITILINAIKDVYEINDIPLPTEIPLLKSHNDLMEYLDTFLIENCPSVKIIDLAFITFWKKYLPFIAYHQFYGWVVIHDYNEKIITFNNINDINTKSESIIKFMANINNKIIFLTNDGLFQYNHAGVRLEYENTLEYDLGLKLYEINEIYANSQSQHEFLLINGSEDLSVYLSSFSCGCIELNTSEYNIKKDSVFNTTFVYKSNRNQGHKCAAIKISYLNDIIMRDLLLFVRCNIVGFFKIVPSEIVAESINIGEIFYKDITIFCNEEISLDKFNIYISDKDKYVAIKDLTKKGNRTIEFVATFDTNYMTSNLVTNNININYDGRVKSIVPIIIKINTGFVSDKQAIILNKNIRTSKFYINSTLNKDVDFFLNATFSKNINAIDLLDIRIKKSSDNDYEISLSLLDRLKKGRYNGYLIGLDKNTNMNLISIPIFLSLD